MRQRGYTLMECLIAIGISITLIGIGTAVYFTVRDRAYQTMCASNLWPDL
ncbi:prepilin-type N-terminal cleavage/methylation domain-containing protein [Candidatus Fervidibacter sacchari]|uniref:Prepilin-type N-terminal cleavage/methylation domain-containing protein n=1 Tax=Candidatus Fervidibacter sacchari TaxID=1448929 RepID=A0ABT2ENX2_9BACT|nr:prepilin-type N-terminal cleavage/methylation domain-containing protein [Candidatus Fervidibacter sacchari]